MNKFKKIFTNKKVKISIIIIISLAVIGGGIFYFLKWKGKKDYSHILIPVKQSEKGDWGFVNLDGELVVDFDLDLDSGEVISYMYNNIAFYNDIQDGELKGITYINEDLKETETDYVNTLYFHDGMALVVEDFGPLQYIDEDFEVALELDYKEAGYFSEGLAMFKNNDDKWGFINKKGDEVIDAEYTSVTSFMHGYSIVSLYDEDDNETEWGVIDKEGDEVIELSDRYTRISIDSKKSFRFYTDDDSGRTDECGFLNLEGDEYIEEDWNFILPFSNGYASFYEWDDDDRDRRENDSYGKWGLIDSDGEEIIKAKEEYPILVENGLYLFQDDDKYGFKNIEKEKIIKAKYDQALPFLGEGAFVKKGNGWDYIDKEGDRIKKKDHNIKQLGPEEDFDDDLLYYVLVYNTPFNLNETLESNVVDIDNMLSSLFPDISYNIFGAEENSDVMDLLDYLIDQNNLIDDLNKDYDDDVDSLYNQISRYDDNLNSYSLFDRQYFIIDENFSYSLNYYFDDNLVQYRQSGYWDCYHSYSCRDYVDYYGASRHRSYYYNTSTDYSRPYEQNPDASLSSIYAYLHLNGTAEGMAEKISEEIEDYLLDNDYNISKGNYTRDDHWIEIDTEGDSYITIRTRFNN